MNKTIAALFYETLEATNPSLVDVVRELVELSQSPSVIAGLAARLAPQDSVLPGLIEGAAQHIKEKA